MSLQILIGTSGWNYPSGKGTWNGVFYPSRRPRGFDELAYYAEHFDTVEVNSTFYRMPEAPMSEAWVRRTPPGFQFAVKLFQKFTHPDMYLGRDGVKRLGSVARRRRRVPGSGWIRSLAPDKLAAILVQFPSSFHAEEETRDYLDWVLEAFDGYPLAVELRHRSWSDDADDTAGRLGAHAASWVLIDEPKFSGSIRQPQPAAADSSGLTYIRLHGRNAAQWWKHDESEDRYNYLYSPGELRPFASAGAPGREDEQARAAVHEQPLLGEVGRQRRDSQAPARSADHGRISAGDGVAVPRAGGRGAAVRPAARSAVRLTRVTPIRGHSELTTHAAHRG